MIITASSSTALKRLALIVVLVVAWTGQAAMAASLMPGDSHSEHHISENHSPENHSPENHHPEHHSPQNHSHGHHGDHKHHNNAAVGEMAEMAMECCPGALDCADGHCIQLVALTSRFSLPAAALLPTLQGSHASPVAVSTATFRPPIFA